MYEGEYHSAVDAKGRSALPVSIKRLMEENKHKEWVLTRGYDTTLFMFESSEWEKLAKKIPQSSLIPDELDFRRFIIGSSARVQMDSAGRILIPQHLRNWADVDRGAALICMDDHIEIWNELRWKQYCVKRVEDFKRIGAEYFGSSSARLIQPKEDVSNA